MPFPKTPPSRKPLSNPLSSKGASTNCFTYSTCCRKTAFASIKIYNQYAEVVPPKCFRDVQVSPSASEFALSNPRVTAAFSTLGLLKALKVGAQTVPVHLDFAK